MDMSRTPLISMLLEHLEPTDPLHDSSLNEHSLLQPRDEIHRLPLLRLETKPCRCPSVGTWKNLFQG